MLAFCLVSDGSRWGDSTIYATHFYSHRHTQFFDVFRKVKYIMCSRTKVITMEESTIFPHFPLKNQREEIDLREKSQSKKSTHGLLRKGPVLYINF